MPLVITELNDNHSIAYCLLGYLCAYFRYYYPLEFITSFLNNAANDDDIKNGTKLATSLKINITPPKWGVSRNEYAFNNEKRIIAKGLGSIKYIGSTVADELFELSKKKHYKTFVELLKDINEYTRVDARQIEILIKLDFFSAFGNQRELLKIMDIFINLFNSGDAKQIKKSKVDDTPIGEVIKKYSVGVTKSGGVAKSYTLLDIESILNESEALVKSVGLTDISETVKAKNFTEYMGYMGYVTDKQEDRRKLYIFDIFPIKRHSDGMQFGYNILTKSIGSGKESRMTVFNRDYDKNPIKKGDVIYCQEFRRKGEYFELLKYRQLV